jgi:transcriptional regulator with XRE-family HTH domain
MWLDNLKELRKSTGMSYKQIAEKTNLPERTVARIFSGDTDNPYVDTLHRIVSVLGGSLDSILADSKAVVGNANLSVLQEDIDRLNSEIERLTNEVNRLEGEVTLISAENSILKDKVNTLTAENDILRIRLEHKEEIISLHNYYNNVKPRT